jgi:hypothetical protein
MKNSPLRFARSIFFLLTTFFIGSTIIAQTSVCELRPKFGIPVGIGNGGGYPRIDFFCQATPSDVETYPGPTVTCRGCVAPGLTPVVHSEGWEKAGSVNCTNFTKEMVMDFSEPLADVEVLAEGARTLTDNRGVVHHIDGTGSRVRFEGPGITRITVSDPVESDSLSCPGCWDMEVAFGTFGNDANYYQCNCNRPTFARPAPQSAFRYWLMV